MFIDNSYKCKTELRNIGIQWLYEACGETTSQTQQNTVVDTGQTKGSFEFYVDEGNLTGYVGSAYENALWEELGTGEYALNGDGRKGGWFYKDNEGKGHWTHGKYPRQAMSSAFVFLKDAITKRLEDLLSGGGDG